MSILSDVAVTFAQCEQGLREQISAGCYLNSMVDPGFSDARGTRPRGSKFFQFYAVFGKFWQNWRLHLGEILDPPLFSNNLQHLSEE